MLQLPQAVQLQNVRFSRNGDPPTMRRSPAVREDLCNLDCGNAPSSAGKRNPRDHHQPPWFVGIFVALGQLFGCCGAGSVTAPPHEDRGSAASRGSRKKNPKVSDCWSKRRVATTRLVEMCGDAACATTPVSSIRRVGRSYRPVEARDWEELRARCRTKFAPQAQVIFIETLTERYNDRTEIEEHFHTDVDKMKAVREATQGKGRAEWRQLLAEVRAEAAEGRRQVLQVQSEEILRIAMLTAF